jgi:hypothetical protein
MTFECTAIYHTLYGEDATYSSHYPAATFQEILYINPYGLNDGHWKELGIS